MIRIAVISDLHGFTNDDAGKPSYMDCKTIGAGASWHPADDLLKLIDHCKLTADVLLCPGDLCDKADQVALQSVWGFLEKVKAKLGASDLLATAGNHDLDSRFQASDYDARGRLTALDPIFPVQDEHLANEFWARNVTVYRKEWLAFFLLNSAAYHGYQKEDVHGRISPTTLGYLKNRISGERDSTLRVLCCHHPPVALTDHGSSTRDFIHGGDQLLKALSEDSANQWLIIHGHKHDARIYRPTGSASTPTVFSAASFSAHLQDELAQNTSNQFYILEFDEESIKTYGAVGRFEAWNWHYGTGWQIARGQGLPARGGFGFETNLPLLGSRIASLLTRSPMEFQTLTVHVPELRFVSPSDFRTLCNRLQSEHEIHLSYDKDGIPKEIGKE